MADYKQTAEDIIKGVGGAENVNKVIHCITRLRFYLNDKDKADTAAIEGISGVAGAVYNEGLGQYQVVIGQAVEDVYDEVISQLGDRVVDKEATDAAVAATAGGDGGNNAKNPLVRAFQVIIATITGSMIPIIGLLAAGGMINGILNIFLDSNKLIPVISASNPTYLIVSTMAMSPFYFLPVLVGFSAAKQLAPKDNSLPYIVAAIGGVLINPGITGIVGTKVIAAGTGSSAITSADAAIKAAGVTAKGATAVMTTDHASWVVTAGKLFQIFGTNGPVFNTSYFGIPVNLPSYAYQIFPIIVAAALARPLNAWLKRVLPLALRSIFQPMITFFVITSVVLLVVGPVISSLSSGLSSLINLLLGSGHSINVVQLGIAAIIIGALYQTLVIFGLHWLIVPLIALQIATDKQSSLNMIVSFTMLAQGAGTLAVFFKTRDSALRGLSLPAAISAFCGVTEPSIYGINLKYSRVFIMSSVGAAVGAGVAGFLNLHMYGFSGSLIGFPNFSNAADNSANFAIFWIASVVCIIVSMVLVWFFGYKNTDVAGAGVEKKNVFTD